MKRLFTAIAAVSLAAGSFGAFADAETDAIFANVITRPAEGVNLDYFDGMYYIGFPDASQISDNPNVVVLKNTSTGTTYRAMTSMASEIAGSQDNGVYYIFTIGTQITEKGEYEVSFPVGAFTINGESNPAFTTHFSIGLAGETPDPDPDPDPDTPVTPVDPSENPLMVFSVTPEPGPAQLELLEVEVTFPELGNDNIMGPIDGKTYSLTDKAGEEYGIRIGTDYKKFTVYIEENLPNGEYTLMLGEGLFELLPEDFLINDKYPYAPMPEILLTYVIDNGSIVAAVAAADTYTVVDLSGRVVLKDVPASALSTLEGGIYVINGVKTIVRR